MSGATSGAVIAATAAAAQKAQNDREEEVTSVYPAGTEELYEYKILRSVWGVFGNPGKLRVVLAEEAEAGWEMVELFDAKRLRLRRRVECRKTDHRLPRDPYRLQVGMGESGFVFLVAGITTVAMLAFVALLMALKR